MMSHSKGGRWVQISVTICDVGGGGGLSVVTSCKASDWYVLSLVG